MSSGRRERFSCEILVYPSLKVV